jgi:hypothetical protein
MDLAGTSVSDQPTPEAAVDTSWSPSSDPLTGSGENETPSAAPELGGE